MGTTLRQIFNTLTRKHANNICKTSSHRIYRRAISLFMYPPGIFALETIGISFRYLSSYPAHKFHSPGPVNRIVRLWI